MTDLVLICSTVVVVALVCLAAFIAWLYAPRVDPNDTGPCLGWLDLGDHYPGQSCVLNDGHTGAHSNGKGSKWTQANDS